MKYAEIIVDVLNANVARVFDYKIPDNLFVIKGSRVVVPFGKRTIDGYVLNIKDKTDVPQNLLKSISKVIESNGLSPEMLELASFMVQKYNIKIIDALRLFILSEVRTGKVKDKLITFVKLNTNADYKSYIVALKDKFPNQKNLLLELESGAKPNAILSKKFGASTIKTLEKKNIIEIFTEKQNRAPSVYNIKNKEIVLNADQEFAINSITNFKRETFVLFGVTGSGKTEVYMHSIEKALKIGKTAILLVPEISLTPQVFGNLKARFGNTVAIIHSGLSSGERFDEWNRLKNGEAKVVVGARSAIFAPLKNVGIIIIDEEHESSYNSETNPRYKTIEIAEFRANYNKCPLVLGSATPSVETFEKTINNEYKLLELPHRVKNIDMPEIQIVDMLAEIQAGNDSIFSRQLINDLDSCFANNKQALLFLNRRGYTSFMRCSECGYVAKCTDCDAPLVYHLTDDLLKCHFCGKKYKALTVCPNCKSPHIRQGAVGTQKVVDEIKKVFPEIPVFRMDNDTTRNKDGHQKILEQFSKCKPAILVGTQMIAKGHDFESVDVVGIIDADQSLYQSDYKSTEKTFQLITQVSGRAGRSEGGGKIDIQTYSPRHFVYKYVANYNYKGFFDKEINVRDTTNYPPFAQIVRILISHEKEEEVINLTKKVLDEVKVLKEQFKDDILFLDAMKSPHTRLKNKFRFQILLRFTKQHECDIIPFIYKVVNKYKNGKCLIFVEINPSSLA